MGAIFVSYDEVTRRAKRVVYLTISSNISATTWFSWMWPHRGGTRLP